MFNFEDLFRQGQEPQGPVDNKGLYVTLGVDKDAQPTVIRKAYLKLARSEHPDKNGNTKESNEKFQEIQQAYDVLKDEKSREVYNKYGMKGISEGRQKQQSNPFQRQRRPEGKPKAKRMVKKVEITLEEAFTGSQITIQHSRYRPCEPCNGQGGEEATKCVTCKGRGVVVRMVQMGPGMYSQSQAHCPKCKGEGEVIKNKCRDCNGEKVQMQKKGIEIPIQPGAHNKLLYNLIGEGHETPDVMAGDLTIVFMMKKHRMFERIGADLYMDKKITLLEALTGFTFNIKTLDKKILKIATEPGQIISHTQSLMIRGKGMPFLNDEMSTGNLFVKFDVQMPESNFIKGKEIDLLKSLLPGPKHDPIDYKKTKYDLLGEFDESDKTESYGIEDEDNQQQHQQQHTRVQQGCQIV